MPNRTLLSEFGRERIVVCCAKCGFVSNLSINVLIGSYGDLSIGSLASTLSGRCQNTSAEKIGSECEFVLQKLEDQPSVHIPMLMPQLVGAVSA